MPKCTDIYGFTSDCFKSFYSCKNKEKKEIIQKPVTEDFVYKQILKLNPVKSTGLDDIPARFIRDGAPVLKIPITYIVNLSITTATVPDDMKVARVKPLYKKNSSLEAGKYRPVSILNVVSKILEKSVYTQLVHFLDENNIIFEFHFRSTTFSNICKWHVS